MKVAIRQIQTFYAEQMQAHGHGSKTFRFEIDAQGDPVVHRLDGDGAAGDQAVTSLDVSPGSVVSLQIFGKDIQNADGISVRFEYDATQVLYEGFDPGDVLPNAQVFALPSTNPTAIEVSLMSFGGKAAVHSGLVGSVRFLTTSAFSGTTLRLRMLLKEP